MHKLAGAGGGAFREIVFFRQHNLEAAPSRIASYTRAIDTAANHKQIVGFRFSHLMLLRMPELRQNNM